MTPLLATAAWWGVAQRDRLTAPGRACLPLPVTALQPSEVRSSRVGVQAQESCHPPPEIPLFPAPRQCPGLAGEGVHPADLEAEGLASATPGLLGSQGMGVWPGSKQQLTGPQI